MKIMHFSEMKAQPVQMEGAEKVTVRWLISAKDGAPHFAMRLFEIEKGGHTPLHVHNSEHEVFIIEGNGALYRDGKEIPLVQGTAVYIPPGETHQFINKGRNPFKFLCMIPNPEI